MKMYLFGYMMINNHVMRIKKMSEKMKTIKVTAPDGYEIDRDKSTFDEIVFKPVEKEFAQSWEELGGIEGYYVNANSYMHIQKRGEIGAFKRNTFATKAQAQSALAMAQLSQLMKEVHEGWVADFDNGSQRKYCIECRAQTIIPTDAWRYFKFLAFETAEKRDNFLATHEALIKVYFQIGDAE